MRHCHQSGLLLRDLQFRRISVAAQPVHEGRQKRLAPVDGPNECDEARGEGPQSDVQDRLFDLVARAENCPATR